MLNHVTQPSVFSQNLLSDILHFAFTKSVYTRGRRIFSATLLNWPKKKKKLTIITHFALSMHKLCRIVNATKFMWNMPLFIHNPTLADLYLAINSGIFYNYKT